MNLHPYIPGGSPCMDLCTLPWASAQLGIETPTEGLAALDLPARTTITWMSYGRDGQPHGYHTGLYTVSEHHVIGYDLGDGTMLVQFWECGNWAVIDKPSPRVDVGEAFTISPVVALAPAAVAHTSSPPVATYWTGHHQHTETPPPLPPPPIAPVPLPAALPLMAAVLLIARGLRG